jgi:hypothetical protein
MTPMSLRILVLKIYHKRKGGKNEKVIIRK